MLVSRYSQVALKADISLYKHVYCLTENCLFCAHHTLQGTTKLNFQKFSYQLDLYIVDIVQFNDIRQF